MNERGQRIAQAAHAPPLSFADPPLSRRPPVLPRSLNRGSHIRFSKRRCMTAHRPKTDAEREKKTAAENGAGRCKERREEEERRERNVRMSVEREEVRERRERRLDDGVDPRSNETLGTATLRVYLAPFSGTITLHSCLIFPYWIPMIVSLIRWVSLPAFFVASEASSGMA